MRLSSPRGSVVLIALSCVTVLGIAMVAFLAVSNTSMRLSNRGYAKAVSKNLAEMGLERALRSFSANTFSSWTLTGGTTATRTLTIAATNYDTSGITATVNIRVEHYRDTKKAVLWSDRTAYAANDFVWYQGVWYLCTTTPPTYDPPNASYWAAVAAWNSATSYTTGTYVVLGGTTVYCCHVANSNRNPSTNATYWSVYNPASNPSIAYDSAKIYVVGDVVSSSGTFYRRILAQGPWETANWKAAPDNWSPQANYRIGNFVLYGGNAYRCLADNINQVPPASGANTYWSAPVQVAPWNVATTYVVDDVVVSGGLAYRCIANHAGQVPPDTTAWLSAPVIYSEGIAQLPDGVIYDTKTQLRAMLAPAPLFPNALGATTDIVMASTGSIDSYNSVLGTYGQTSAPFSAGSPNTGSSAVVAGGDTTSTSVAIGNMRIRGYVAAPSSSNSPYLPLTSNSTSGVVTSTASGTPTTPIDPTRLSRSPYIPQFDIKSVTGSNLLPNNTTVLDYGSTTLGTPGATSPSIYRITDTGYAGQSGLYLANSTDILTISGPVILYVVGTVYTSNGKIVILPGGSLEIYFTGQLWIGSSTTSGIQNLTQDPRKCFMAGTSTGNSAGSHYYWTTMPLTFTTLYMPSAYVRTWSNVPFYGAISASNIGFPNAGVAFHYDTALRTAGAIGTFIDGPYITSEVRELIDSTERVTLP